MDLVRNLLGSTIGKKLLMAATGLVLIAFVTGHLVGNLQVFENPDRINGYAHFLQSLGPALWAVRVFLLACAAIHIWAGTVLALEDRKARGDEPRSEEHTSELQSLRHLVCRLLLEKKNKFLLFLLFALSWFVFSGGMLVGGAR